MYCFYLTLNNRNKYIPQNYKNNNNNNNNQHVPKCILLKYFNLFILYKTNLKLLKM